MVLTRLAIHRKFRIIDGGTTYDYDAIIKMVDKWHVKFNMLNLHKGSVIAANSPQTIFHYSLVIALAERGMTYLAIPASQYVGVKTDVFDPSDVGLTMWFTDRTITPTANSWGIPVDNIEDVDLVVTPDNFSPNIEAEDTDVLIIGATSGTTSSQKLISHSHETLMRAATNAAALYSDEDRTLLFSSMNHIGSVSVQVLAPMLAGCDVFVVKWDISEIFRHIRENAPTKMVVFWPIFASMRDHPEWPSVRFDSFNAIISGGSLLRKTYCETLFSKGAKSVINIYGLTEAPPPLLVHTVTPHNILDSFSGESPYLGEVVGDWEIRIEKDNSLLVKGQSLGLGNHMAKSIVDGYYPTGDMAEYINGKLYYCGRAKVMIRLANDEQVDATAIRSVLTGYTGGTQENIIRMCSIYLDRSHKLTALIMISDGFELNKADLNNHIAEKLGNSSRLDRIAVVKGIVMFDRLKDTLNRSDEDTMELL